MTQKNKISLRDLFPSLGLLADEKKLQQYGSTIVERISTAKTARAGSLVFIATEVFLKELIASPFMGSVLVVNEALYEKLPESFRAEKICFATKDAMLAFAKASAFFATEASGGGAVHASAVVHPSAKIGKNVTIGPACVVEADAVIGDHSILHAQVYVGPRVVMGSGTVLFPGVKIYQDTQIGNNVRIHGNTVIGADGFGYAQERHATGVTHVKIHHLGAVRLGNDIEIGASSTIDRGTIEDTILENGCMIDDQVHIGHNCHLEEGVIVCGCTGIAGSVHVGKYAVIAGLVGVGNGADIGAGAQIAAYTMVFGKIPAGIKWAGVPGRPMRETMRLQAMLLRLPDMYNDWKKTKKDV